MSNCCFNTIGLWRDIQTKFWNGGEGIVFEECQSCVRVRACARECARACEHAYVSFRSCVCMLSK